MTTRDEQIATVMFTLRMPWPLMQRWNKTMEKLPRGMSKNAVLVQLLTEWCRHQEVQP